MHHVQKNIQAWKPSSVACGGTASLALDNNFFNNFKENINERKKLEKKKKIKKKIVNDFLDNNSYEISEEFDEFCFIT